MKQKLLFLVFLATAPLMAQTINRIEVNGVILAKDRDVEGITIYNASSKKGTITNEKGAFVIEVAKNDVIEISALQFEILKVTITEEVIDSKQLHIYMVDHVNQLNAVLLRHGLSGYLTEDLNNVVHLPKIELNIGNINAWEFEVDRSFDNSVVERELNRVVNKDGLYDGMDFIKIKNLLFKPKKKMPSQKELLENKKPILLADVFSRQHLSRTFNIPSEKVEGFIAFIENKGGVPEPLFEDNREIDLIDFLVTERNLFLNQSGDKN